MTSHFRSPLLQAAVIVIISLAVMIVIFPSPFFESNDDAAMYLIVSGKLLSVSPDAHIVFSNYLIGVLLKSLFVLVPGIPWYGIFHVGAIFFVIFYLNYIFAVYCDQNLFACRVVVSVLCLLPFAIAIQFTKTSFLLAMSAYLSLYLIARKDIRTKLTIIISYVVIPVLLLTSYCMRRESFFLATIACFAFLVFGAKSNLKKFTFTFTITSVLIVFSVAYNNANYEGSWVRFLKVQNFTSRLTDYNKVKYEQNEKIFSAVNWSNNDYEVIRTLGHLDAEIYGPDNIEYVLKNASNNDGKSFKRLFKDGFRYKYTKAHAIIASVVFLMVLLALSKQEMVLCVVYVLGPFFFIFALLFLNGRLTPWVSAPIMCFLPWSSLAVRTGKEGSCRRFNNRVFVCALIIVLLLGLHRQERYLEKIKHNRILSFMAMRDLLKTEKIIVSWSGAFPFESIDPMDNNDYLDDVNVIFFSCFNQSEIQNKVLQYCGLANVFDDLSKNKKITFAISERHIPLLKRYMEEHYLVGIELIPIFAGHGIKVYRSEAKGL